MYALKERRRLTVPLLVTFWPSPTCKGMSSFSYLIQFLISLLVQFVTTPLLHLPTTPKSEISESNDLESETFNQPGGVLRSRSKY